MKDGKPFVKWVGGKTQLIKNIEKSLPSNLLTGDEVTYIEPFVGGGALLFWILQMYPNVSRAVINDINPVLTNAYSVVKTKPYELIAVLEKLQIEYFKIENEEKRKEFFLSKRLEFNELETLDVKNAALFIFLNKTCFNGLYRVNKSGKFNVPFGRYANPKICDSQTILSDSQLLQRVEILTGDFTQTFDYVNEDSLLYLDPPYKPISTTSSFTTYSKEDFNDDDQIRLSEFCHRVNDRKAKFILSNSDLKNGNPENNFFDNLYNSYNIERVYASRFINSKSSGRGAISELMVSNL